MALPLVFWDFGEDCLGWVSPFPPVGQGWYRGGVAACGNAQEGVCMWWALSEFHLCLFLISSVANVIGKVRLMPHEEVAHGRAIFH